MLKTARREMLRTEHMQDVPTVFLIQMNWEETMTSMVCPGVDQTCDTLFPRGDRGDRNPIAGVVVVRAERKFTTVEVMARMNRRTIKNSTTSEITLTTRTTIKFTTIMAAAVEVDTPDRRTGFFELQLELEAAAG
jgi:hypothetical protein